jgi:hypothetical protein
MSAKRAAIGDQVKSSRKRQKTESNPDPVQTVKGQSEQNGINIPRQDQVFRFMELPGGKYCYLHFSNQGHPTADVGTLRSMLVHMYTC